MFVPLLAGAVQRAATFGAAGRRSLGLRIVVPW